MKKRKNLDEDKSILHHLSELRKRIFISLFFILVFFIISWNFIEDIYGILALPILKYLPKGEKLAFTALTEPFIMYVKLAFISGLFFSSPFVFHQLWLFVSPALYRKEVKFVIPFVFFSSLLFVGGGVFGYFIIFPWAVKFFLQVGSQFRAIITVSQYFSLMIRILVGIAIIFELPMLVFILSKFRIISARFLIKYFKYAIVIIFIIAAVITPTPDMITQSIFALPMIILYGISILIAKIVNP